jgi:hypothetical protein
MTVRTDEPRSASGDPKPEAGRDAPLPGLAPPDGYDNVRHLTPKQRTRLRKKVRGTQRRDPEAAYVTCEGCGWTGFDHHLPHDPDVTPCPDCGGDTATLACPPADEDRWW